MWKYFKDEKPVDGSFVLFSWVDDDNSQIWWGVYYGKKTHPAPKLTRMLLRINDNYEKIDDEYFFKEGVYETLRYDRAATAYVWMYPPDPPQQKCDGAWAHLKDRVPDADVDLLYAYIDNNGAHKTFIGEYIPRGTKDVELCADLCWKFDQAEAVHGKEYAPEGVYAIPLDGGVSRSFASTAYAWMPVPKTPRHRA